MSIAYPTANYFMQIQFAGLQGWGSGEEEKFVQAGVSGALPPKAPSSAGVESTVSGPMVRSLGGEGHVPNLQKTLFSE